SPIAFGGRPATDCWLDAAGVLVASLGQALRALVIGLAYIRRGGRNKAIYADDLVTDGFFAHSRNPLYLGNMLVYLGLFLILNSVVGWVAGVPFFLAAYLCITAAEEDYLARRFGAAYRAYCQRVPRFLPRLAGLGATTRGMRFQWRRLIRKEYGSTYAWTVTVLLLLAYERLLWSGSAASWAQLRWLALAWGLLTVLYVAARWLKKTRRLEDC
ncbi:MAG: isoprenylcysteine carboxylmethyltransferase family protein, partial [Salinisphaera sp.]|nr:isoprenylcysteine carboxylmethyltransferase family protein [Salinisphaera sp.]